MAVITVSPDVIIRHFTVGGMTCAACVRRVQRTLIDVPGVQAALVKLDGHATVTHGPAVTTEALRAAVTEAGYILADTADAAVTASRAERPARSMARLVTSGMLAAAALVGFYLGTITLAQGWDHAVEQLQQDLFFVAALASGFGIQVGLFIHLRQHCAVRPGGVAVSTSTSNAAMLACCAHHLVDVLPVLGVSALAAFLGAYKAPLLWASLAMNLAGVAYLTYAMRRVTVACRSGR